MKIRLLVAIAVLTHAACTPSLHVESESLHVASETWEGDWPLTVPSGTLECWVFSMDATIALGFPPLFAQGPLAFFRTDDGEMYWLSSGGLPIEAQKRLDAEPGIDAIWRDHPAVSGAKISLDPMINRARGLCD